MSGPTFPKLNVLRYFGMQQSSTSRICDKNYWHSARLVQNGLQAASRTDGEAGGLLQESHRTGFPAAGNPRTGVKFPRIKAVTNHLRSRIAEYERPSCVSWGTNRIVD